MRAAMLEALTPLLLASSANCLFQPSNPPAVLPHCAAPALLAIDMSATKAVTVIALNRQRLIIENSFQNSLRQTKRAHRRSRSAVPVACTALSVRAPTRATGTERVHQIK